MKPYFVLAVLAVLLGYSQSTLHAQNAEAVFNTVSPSVVLIKDLESHGSGVVISSSGLILTNFHVVNTPLPLTVTAQAYKAGKLQSVTLEDATVLKVHPEYDLAILKVKLPPGVTLKARTLMKPRVKTGQECFVLGNPGGASGQVLTNSISTGIVSTADREIDGKHYIQTTAAINPGNSGGALLDSRGNLIGIITFIISDTEGIGFAIPVSEFSTSEFISPMAIKGDPEKALEYKRIGELWLKKSQSYFGEQRGFALFIAYMAFRMAIAECPADPSGYDSLGTTYSAVHENKIAKFYFEKAVEIDGEKTPLYLKNLGNCYEELQDLKQAQVYWEKAVSCQQQDFDTSEAAGRLSGLAFSQNKILEGTYLARWSQALGDQRHDTNRQGMMQSDLGRALMARLTEKQRTYLQSKQSGFSLQDMKNFVAGRIDTVNVASNTASTPIPNRRPIRNQPNLVAESPTPKTVDTPAAEVKMEEVDTTKLAESFKESLDKALKDAIVPPDEGSIKSLPETPSDCRPARAGVYLAMRFDQLKKIGLYNVAQQKFDHYFPLPSEQALYACGGDVLVIFDPGQALFHVYNLTTFEKTATRMSTVPGQMDLMEMGTMTSDRMVVSWSEGSNALDQRKYGMLSVPNMDLTLFKANGTRMDQGFQNDRFRDKVHIRLSPDSKQFLSWCSSHSPTGFIYGTLHGPRVTSSYQHDSPGCLSFLMDGNWIVGSRGDVMDQNARIRHRFGNPVLYAVDGAGMVIKVDGGTNNARLIEASSFSQVRQYTLPFKFPENAMFSNKLATDRLVFASAYLNRVVFLDQTGIRTVTYRISDNKVQSQTLAEQLGGVKAGDAWQRKIQCSDQAKVRVEDAPKGVNYDAATRSLHWDIPQTIAPGSYIILLSVTEPGKPESYQRVVLTIK